MSHYNINIVVRERMDKTINIANLLNLLYLLLHAWTETGGDSAVIEHCG